jgi:O-acetyl-ADP-ribose deacetylase
LAFPSISTGVYGYPRALAARIAVTTARFSAQEHSCIEEIVFCCFSSVDLAVYEDLLQEIDP